jgi:hypothetical protein
MSFLKQNLSVSQMVMKAKAQADKGLEKANQLRYSETGVKVKKATGDVVQCMVLGFGTMAVLTAPATAALIGGVAAICNEIKEANPHRFSRGTTTYSEYLHHNVAKICEVNHLDYAKLTTYELTRVTNQAQLATDYLWRAGYYNTGRLTEEQRMELDVLLNLA